MQRVCINYNIFIDCLLYLILRAISINQSVMIEMSVLISFSFIMYSITQHGLTFIYLYFHVCLVPALKNTIVFSN